jgi:hypothetical protein
MHLQSISILSTKVIDGNLVFSNPPQQPRTLDGLLSVHELIKVLEEKDRLTGERNDLVARLKPLAPHLL